MSPVRIVLPFAIAGYAAYLGYSHPGQQWWYGFAGLVFVLGIYRVIKYRQTNSQAGPGTDKQP